MESGLAQEWLESCLDDDALSKIIDPDHAKPYWSDVRTRRPLFHHPVELKLPYGGENFIQAGGKIVAIFHEEFSLENSDKIVAFARKHEIGELKIRLPIDPSIQPNSRAQLIDNYLQLVEKERDLWLNRARYNVSFSGLISSIERLPMSRYAPIFGMSGELLKSRS